MKRLIFGVMVLGLAVTSVTAKTIMAEEFEPACHSKSRLEFLMDGMTEAKGWAETKGLFMSVHCWTIDEGMDLKIIKTKLLNVKKDKKHTKALLIKLPDGSTAYIAR